MHGFVFAVSGVALLCVTFLAGRASAADGGFQDWTFVRDSSGTVWLMNNGLRTGIPITAASDDQIMAVPESGLWVVPGTSGTMGRQRPDWDVSAGGVAPPVTAAAPNPAPPAQPEKPVEQPVNFSGTQDQNTRAFLLTGGNYTWHWKGTVRSSINQCVLYGYLVNVASGRRVENIGGILRGKGEEGDTQIYNLPSGQYYFDISSTCAWEVSIAPQ